MVAEVTTSIIITAYDREHQLTRTLESIEKQNRKDVEIVLMDDRRPRAKGEFLNPAPLLNEGIRRAKGELLIIQNAECLHVGPVIYQFEQKVAGFKAVFASVLAEKQDGSPDRWYCHPRIRPVPYFFCGAIHRKHALDVMFDERFTGAGYDDVDFANRLEEQDVKFEFRDDIQVIHQWHKPFQGNSSMNEVYRLKREAEGKTVRLYP